MNAKKLMIIDGNSIINRAFYGIGLLSNAEGLYTNAVYGFLSIYFKYLEEENPDYVCVAFDMKAPTFRHKEFDGYKAQRKGMPDELAMQLPVLKQVLEAMNVLMLQKEGYEADDIIGTVSRLCEEKGIQCIIVTGDKDSLQLASQRTRIKLPITRGGTTQTHEYDEQKVMEKYGVTPEQFIDVKGLMGDPSDNIPGVTGVGEKTALSLIREYKSIENVYENIENIKVRKNVKESLITNKEMAFLSKRLATINRAAPIEFDFEASKKEEYHRDKLLELFRRLEFKSMIQKLGLETVEQLITEAKESEEEYRHITTIEELRKIAQEIEYSDKMVYILYTDERQQDRKLLSISFMITGENGYAAYIDINHELTDTAVMEILKPIFESKEIQKVGHNIKEDIVLLHEYGVMLQGIHFDTMIGAYLVNPSRSTYHIDEIAQEFLGISVPSSEAVLGKGAKMVSIKEIEADTAVHYACRQVSVLPKLTQVLKEKIEEYGQQKLYYDVELPLVEVLADMQIIGFKADREKLNEFSATLNKKIKELEQRIHHLAGEEFNINSPKQLGVILFEKLDLPVVKKTKTGYSTNVEVLEKLKGKHEIIELLMEYRQLVKLKSTYADGLVNVINQQTGKIHSNFNQTVTVTGRISSTEPNLQNIPVKLDLGREIRKMFIASDNDYVLVDADYSQIELRVLAHISDDPNMIEAFVNHQDIHRRTASQVFGVPMEQVTPLMRSRAKAVNFGIVYGIGDFSLSQDLGITRKEARKYIDGYLEKYSKVKQYMHDIVEQAKREGYVSTLLNRRRYVPELQSKNFAVRSFGERVSMNTPIQGSAADIIKIAMVSVYRELKRRKLKSRLILQVHDELIVETHKSELEEVKEIVKNQMMNAVQLKVPLEVDLNVGNSWYEAK